MDDASTGFSSELNICEVNSMVHCLSELSLNETAKVDSVVGKSSMARRLMDIGFINGEKVECVLKTAGMDAYIVRGAVIALRTVDATSILI